VHLLLIIQGAQAPNAALTLNRVALGLFFAIEGIFLAAFPIAAKRAMAAALETPESRLRIAGLVSAVVGVLIVWLVRH